MIYTIIKYFIVLGLFVSCLWVVYEYGYEKGSSNVKIEYITKEVETIKYVEKERAVIHSKPNDSRDGLLSKMRSGNL